MTLFNSESCQEKLRVPIPHPFAAANKFPVKTKQTYSKIDLNQKVSCFKC